MFVIHFFYKIIVYLFQLSILVVKCSEFKSRTFGSDEVDITKVPYTVHISTGCTGALIRTQWVLTATHCFLGKMGWTNMTVSLGTTDRKIRNYKISIAKVYIEPNFLGTGTWAARHDIALVKLADPAVLSQNVQLLKLETKQWPKILKKYCTIAGFSENKNQTTTLHMGTFYFSHGCDCIQEWHIICIHTLEDGNDSPYFGDSGSIVVCGEKGAAVTSGTVGPRFCAGIIDYPEKKNGGANSSYHLFTYIRPHLNWIRNIIQKDANNTYLSSESKANILGVWIIQSYDLITNLQLFAFLVIFYSCFC